MQGISIEQATHPTDDIRALIAALDQTLAAEYPPEQRHGISLDAIFQPHIRFFQASFDGQPAGCGGVALLDGFAEVKRMYVGPALRGRGIARALLARIETTARAAGKPWLRLETGTSQHAAIRLYERAGFQHCGPFGAYAEMPPALITTSVFMEKPLT